MISYIALIKTSRIYFCLCAGTQVSHIISVPYLENIYYLQFVIPTEKNHINKLHHIFSDRMFYTSLLMNRTLNHNIPH
jgi:hypothetical protein